MKEKEKQKRIVLKFGTGTLTKVRGAGLDSAQFRKIAREVSQLVLSGSECVIVSSGAVGAGLQPLGFRERPADLPGVQACAAVGQSKLMQLYATVFARHGISVAQLLLTHGDLDSRTRYANARNTLRRLLSCRNVVPIINENDSVAVEELRFGDNDRLSAEVAILAGAQLLILLTDADGLQDGDGKRVPFVTDIEKASRLARADKGRHSVGGMASKLQAVKAAIHAGITTVIADGRRPGQIVGIVNGKALGTRFEAKGKR